MTETFTWTCNNSTLSHLKLNVAANGNTNNETGVRVSRPETQIYRQSIYYVAIKVRTKRKYIYSATKAVLFYLLRFRCVV